MPKQKAPKAGPKSISEAVRATEERLSAQDLAAIAEAEAGASAARMEAARAAADAAAEKQYQETAKDLKVAQSADAFTDKRSGDVIFRRELGEPEFWLEKKDRIPQRPVLTEDEAKEISRRVEIPTDQIPRYDPQFILSKEYGGTSNYEVGISRIRDETEERLEMLESSGAGEEEIRKVREDLKKLDHLYENFHIGMNVFRTAHGGRDRIKK